MRAALPHTALQSAVYLAARTRSATLADPRSSPSICLSVVRARDFPAVGCWLCLRCSSPCGQSIPDRFAPTLSGRVCLPAALPPSPGGYGGHVAPRALPHFSAPMAALTPAGRVLRALSATMNSRPAPAGLPSSRVLSFPDILSPTTPAGTSRASVMRRGGCGARAPQTSPVSRRLVAAARAESCSFVIMVCLVVSVAPHPASRRRSYFNFSAAQRLPPA